MSWGSGKWGSFSWGSGQTSNVPTISPTIEIEDALVLGTSLLRVDFNNPVKRDGNLMSPSSYVITPLGGGAPVTVQRVISPTGGSTSYVMLSVTAITVGEEYLIDIVNIRGANGDIVNASNSSDTFFGKNTKFDLAQSLQQKMYSREPDSVLSSILIAITGEDEKIGGSEGGNE